MIATILVACALVIFGYLLGATMARRSIAGVFDRRFTCHACGSKVDRAISLSRCGDCREEYVGPPIADEIRDDCFFDGSA